MNFANQEDYSREDEEIVMEIAKLREEQKALEEELQGMTKRLETTERRPHQMMAFLYKVVEDPDILPRMMLQNKERTNQLKEKKRHLAISSTTTSSNFSSPSVKTEELEDDLGTTGVVSSSSPETGFEMESFYQSSPSPEGTPVAGWWGQGGFTAVPSPLSAVQVAGIGNGAAVANSAPSIFSGYGNASSGSGQIGYFAESNRPPVQPPYPFSLFGGGF